MLLRRAAAAVLTALCAAPVGAEWQLAKGYVGLEAHYYPQEGAGDQGHGNAAGIAELELFDFLGDAWTAKLTPFARLDAVDTSRHRFDLREAELEYQSGPWTFSGGMRKVSWSVTESVNLVPHQVVDILNQRDLAGDPSGKEKLGAAMLRGAWQGERVLAEAFILPWFREREFPSTEAREHPFSGAVDLPGEVSYTDGNEEFQPGFALRLEAVLGPANLAFIQSRGYAPQPALSFDTATGALNSLYYQVDMSAVTVQASVGTWLLKTESAWFDTGLNPDGFSVPDSYFSTVTGVEYTFIRPSKTADLSVIAEWMYDERGDGLDGVQFQNDLFAGLRWAANDLFGTEIVGGVVHDLEADAAIFHAEYKRRIGDSQRLEVVVRAFSAEDDHPMSAVTDDTLLKVRYRWFF